MPAIIKKTTAHVGTVSGQPRVLATAGYKPQTAAKAPQVKMPTGGAYIGTTGCYVAAPGSNGKEGKALKTWGASLKRAGAHPKSRVAAPQAQRLLGWLDEKTGTVTVPADFVQVLHTIADAGFTQGGARIALAAGTVNPDGTLTYDAKMVRALQYVCDNQPEREINPAREAMVDLDAEEEEEEEATK